MIFQTFWWRKEYFDLILSNLKHVRYSPNIKEMKILDRKKVRRAKLYYLRDRMNALKK